MLSISCTFVSGFTEGGLTLSTFNTELIIFHSPKRKELNNNTINYAFVDLDSIEQIDECLGNYTVHFNTPKVAPLEISADTVQAYQFAEPEPIDLYKLKEQIRHFRKKYILKFLNNLQTIKSRQI